MKQGSLPEDFPSHAALAVADVNTYAQVRNLKGDYSEIAGIGAARGAEIDAALVAVEEESETAEVALAETPTAEVPIVTPDLDLTDLKSRVAFAKPRNESLIKEVKDTLGTAQQAITEAADALDKLIHPELS